ncbi:MAG: NAD(P)-dependent oxidoreductase, partial [Brevinema sp.]
MKIICYGVRSIEKDFFHRLNSYDFELILVEDLLRYDNIDFCEGADAVMLRGNCKTDRQTLEKMKNFGIRFLLTRTVGTDHIDLEAVLDLGFELCAHVPHYSSNAISELAISMVLGFTRNTFAVASHTSQKNFLVLDRYFSKEIRFLTVGIIGMGRIGLQSARGFIGLEAKVIAVDPHPSEEAKKIVSFVSIDELQNQADVIILHVPYIKNENYHLINHEFINNLKKQVIL